LFAKENTAKYRILPDELHISLLSFHAELCRYVDDLNSVRKELCRSKEVGENWGSSH
jgi:hypothetical protein